MGEQFRDGEFGQLSSFSQGEKVQIPLPPHSGHGRIQILTDNTFPSIAKPVKDFVFVRIQSIIVMGAVMTIGQLPMT